MIPSGRHSHSGSAGRSGRFEGQEMNWFEDWYRRKLARPTTTIRGGTSVEAKFVKIYGPRCAYARIVLAAEPSQEFEFRSEVTWPVDPDPFNAAVVDGILDELLASDLGRIASRVRFILRDIGWHDVDSSPLAFY